MGGKRRVSWRIILLPLVLVGVVYLFSRMLARGDRTGAVLSGLWIVATLVDLATVWRKRYWRS
jgi:hypothetical protein